MQLCSKQHAMWCNHAEEVVCCLQAGNPGASSGLQQGASQQDQHANLMAMWPASGLAFAAGTSSGVASLGMMQGQPYLPAPAQLQAALLQMQLANSMLMQVVQSGAGAGAPQGAAVAALQQAASSATGKRSQHHCSSCHQLLSETGRKRHVTSQVHRQHAQAWDELLQEARAQGLPEVQSDPDRPRMRCDALCAVCGKHMAQHVPQLCSRTDLAPR